MAPKHSAKVLSSVSKCKKAVMPLGEKNTCTGLPSFRHELAMNSMLMSQQYILNKVSLNTLNKTQTKYKQNMVVY